MEENLQIGETLIDNNLINDDNFIGESIKKLASGDLIDDNGLLSEKAKTNRHDLTIFAGRNWAFFNPNDYDFLNKGDNTPLDFENDKERLDIYNQEDERYRKELLEAKTNGEFDYIKSKIKEDKNEDLYLQQKYGVAGVIVGDLAFGILDPSSFVIGAATGGIGKVASLLATSVKFGKALTKLGTNTRTMYDKFNALSTIKKAGTIGLVEGTTGAYQEYLVQEQTVKPFDAVDIAMVGSGAFVLAGGISGTAMYLLNRKRKVNPNLENNNILVEDSGVVINKTQEQELSNFKKSIDDEEKIEFDEEFGLEDLELEKFDIEDIDIQPNKIEDIETTKIEDIETTKIEEPTIKTEDIQTTKLDEQTIKVDESTTKTEDIQTTNIEGFEGLKVFTKSDSLKYRKELETKIKEYEKDIITREDLSEFLKTKEKSFENYVNRSDDIYKNQLTNYKRKIEDIENVQESGYFKKTYTKFKNEVEKLIDEDIYKGDNLSGSDYVANVKLLKLKEKQVANILNARKTNTIETDMKGNLKTVLSNNIITQIQKSLVKGKLSLNELKVLKSSIDDIHKERMVKGKPEELSDKLKTFVDTRIKAIEENNKMIVDDIKTSKESDNEIEELYVATKDEVEYVEKLEKLMSDNMKIILDSEYKFKVDYDKKSNTLSLEEIKNKRIREKNRKNLKEDEDETLNSIEEIIDNSKTCSLK